MTAEVSFPRSPLVALWHKGIDKLMEITLHLGAHRTGTTSFQQYLRNNRARLRADGTEVWEPQQLRKGMFDGLFAAPRMLNGRDQHARAVGRIGLHVAQAETSGAKRLLISEENMIGAPRACLRSASLYPAIGERMARLEAAFKGRITRVVMCVRAQDLWWSSVAAYSVARGHALPDAAKLEALATSPRTWRDVIADLACALPNAHIKIAPFEQYAGQFDAIAALALDRAAPHDNSWHWLNRSPNVSELRNKMNDFGVPVACLPAHLAAGEGRWNPFTTEQAANLREAYADDMMWLTAGADGLATLTEEFSRTRAGPSLPAGALKKGQYHDQDTDDPVKGEVAHTG